MSSPAAPAAEKARYTTGSTMRHVLVLASTSSIGLVAIFIVDFLNLFYISLLHDPRFTAAVGFASALVYFYVSLSIGLMIAATALVARNLGAGNRPLAREVAGSAVAWLLLIVGGIRLVEPPLRAGAARSGRRRRGDAVARRDVHVDRPPLDAAPRPRHVPHRAPPRRRRSQAGDVHDALVWRDHRRPRPVFILGFGLGVPGAAIATVLARVAMVAYGLNTLIRRHDMIALPTVATARRDLVPLARIGVPAVLTNIATPVGNGYITAAVAAYGDPAVAGWTIVSRLVPVAFGGLFALAGAVGPVVGQNFGARLFDRVRRALTESLIVSTIYVAVVCLILLIAQHGIVAAFGASGKAADIVLLFCRYLAVTFVFAGGLYVSNAAFNNLGYPALSTALNWARATLGTVPFAIAGAWLGGDKGVLTGFFLGGIPFGIVAILICYRIIAGLGVEQGPAAARRSPFAMIGLGSRHARPRSATRG